MAKPVSCPVCFGPGVLLGTLGWLRHFTCRDCGMQFHRKLRKRRKARASTAQHQPAPRPA